MAAKTLALHAALKQAIVISHQLSGIILSSPECIQIQAFIDNNDMYEVIYSLKWDTATRVLVDTINSGHFTKFKVFQSKLEVVLRSN